MKYIDKTWCERDAAAVPNNVAAARTPPSSSSSSSSKSSSRRKTTATSAPVPAAASVTAAPAAADPFGFDSITPSSVASSANNTSWDAFGAAPAATFQADFGNMNGTSAPTMPTFQADFGAMNGSTATPQPPAPAATSFQANFGNNFSQHTMVSMPPQVPPQMPPPPPPPHTQGQPQQQQMNPPMSQQQQHQQPGHGNYGQTHTGNQQQQPFQANFDQGMMQPPQQQQQQQLVQQIPFQANFDQGQKMMQQQQVMPQQPPASVPAPDFQAKFDQVSQNDMVSTNQQQQQHQQSFQANFGQLPATMVPQQQQQQQQPPQINVRPAEAQTVQGAGGQMTMNQQASGMNFGQFPQQQQMVNDYQGGMNATQQMHLFPQQPVSSKNVQSNSSANISQTPENQPHQPQQELQPEAINPNAFKPADVKKDAFSAFDSLSLEPTNSRGGAKTPVREVGNYPAQKPNNLQFTKFKEGQQVVYTNGEGAFMALIKKVHFDDELHPYYTIDLNGREKQTDDAHLSFPNETAQNQPSKPSNESSAKLEETAAMLKNLSESQLLEVQRFIASLQSSAQPTPMPSMGMTPQGQNNSHLSYSQQHMGGMHYQQNVGMGGVPAQNPNHEAQQRPMPPSQTSFQPPNQTPGISSNMGGMPTQMNAQQPMMQQPILGMGQMAAPMQQYTPAPAQMYAQQPAMQQPTLIQGMGNTGMPQMTTQQRPIMPNTGSAQAQQQLPNPQMIQPMGVAQPYVPSPTMTPPPNTNLPPVEKQGNPFDVY